MTFQRPYFSTIATLLAFASPGFAAGGSFTDLQAISFTAINEAAGRMIFARASVKLEPESNSDSESWCSGSYISDSGHILTAAHCLDVCQGTTGKIRPKTCPFKVNGRTRILQVIMMPNCPSMGRYLSDPLHAPASLKNCAGEKDFAVLLLSPESLRL